MSHQLRFVIAFGALVSVMALAQTGPVDEDCSTAQPNFPFPSVVPWNEQPHGYSCRQRALPKTTPGKNWYVQVLAGVHLKDSVATNTDTYSLRVCAASDAGTPLGAGIKSPCETKTRTGSGGCAVCDVFRAPHP
jgi:hypothetical protein